MLARPNSLRALITAVVAIVMTSPLLVSAQDAVRPMTFLDMRNFRSVSAPTPSPSGDRLLYVMSTPDWQEAKSQTDLYLVSTKEGVPSTRQMTFTTEKNESSPRWARDLGGARSP